MPTDKKPKQAKNEVTVRMFCQGLGDCFLITIPQKGTRPYSILIDFGVAMGTPRAEEIMRAVVGKVTDLTKGTVDLLVVTHEHWDHVSGFVQAAEALGSDRIEFKHLWCAWTENRNDGLAKELRAKYSKMKLALGRARQLLARLGMHPRSAGLMGLDGVLAFHGPAAAEGQGLDDAMATTRKLVGADEDETKMDCLMPGGRVALPGASAPGLAAGVRAYVLGPPHVAEKVTRINPSKKDKETYEKQPHAALALGVNWAWLATAMKEDIGIPGLAGDPADQANFVRSRPFDPREGIGLEAARTHPFFRDRYFEGGEQEDWRRIDGDWLWSGAQRLALHLESYTNNTSLVLAFELPVSKKVLLFAGDAQVGNWLSWHDQEYAAGDGHNVTAATLLGRTVLYKVGHHGSHNATLREKGLELMTNPELVVMLPVEAEAVKRLRYGEMPLVDLMTALTERTRGRVLRLDEPWQEGRAPGVWGTKLKRAKTSTETITVGKDGETSTRPLYMEYVIRDS